MFAKDREQMERELALQAMAADITKAMQPPEHLTALSQMMNAIQWQHRELANARVYDDMMKQVAQMRFISENITSPFQMFTEKMRSQSDVFEGLSARLAATDNINFSIPKFTQKMLAWNIASIGLTNRMNDIGLLARRETLSTRLLETPNAYVAFLQNTTDRLVTDLAADVAARLRGSLNLAEYQLLEITNTVSNFVAVPEDNEEPDSIRVLAVPYKQQDELLKYEYVQNENDVVALITASPTAQTTQIAHRVLKLVTQCNEAGKTSESGLEIFKPTTRLMTVFNDLPWLSATNSLEIGNVVDCLYFIFYEGAGKDNLRFLDKNGGPLTNADCDLIWCIKLLRNKWSRHDADHGEEKDIKKSWAELATKFRLLGLDEYPTAPDHFQQIHRKLLILAEDFLTRLLSKLKLRSGN
jgi:uncharacterized protein YaaR (DUF327 family)